MSVNKFKDFCSWLTMKSIMENSSNPNWKNLDLPINYSVNLYSNDAEFTSMSYEYNKELFSYLNQSKKDLDKLLNFNVGYKLKLDSSFLSHDDGLTLKQIIKIASEFGTDKISISGDGNDYSYSELTSGHDSEIIIKISLENKELLLEKYKIWENELKNQKQEKKANKLK